MTSFAERRDGKVWVGTDGGGLYSFDRVSGTIKRVPLPIGGGQGDRLTVLSLVFARSGRLYIGTLGEGVDRDGYGDGADQAAEGGRRRWLRE